MAVGLEDYITMSYVVHRVTAKYIPSVNTPDFPDSDWLINPDLSNVDGVLPKYWKVENGEVLEMTALEKEAVDNPPLPPANVHNAIIDAFGGPSVTGIPYI